MIFPMLKEARREVLDDLMDLDHATWVIDQLERGKIKIVETYKDFPSPFAFHLVMQGYSDIFKIEDRMEFLKRMHEKVLRKIESPDEKGEFSYQEMWKLMEEGKKQLEVEKIEELKREVVSVEGLSTPMKQALIDIIDGEEAGQEVMDYLKAENHLDDFPATLRKFLKKYLEQHDLQSRLLAEFDTAWRKMKLDDDIYYEGKQIILGKRQYVSRKFKEWLEVLLDGAIPYAYEKDIARFLMRIRGEIQ
jgi:hypothetical protein